ncbi:MAG TPA: SDR family NAD(P)-dependent oxidoreductase [Actinomycetota bacterium]
MRATRVKTCVVTGGSSGIGKEIARGLATADARVVIVARNSAKAEAAAEEIGGSVDVVLADLSVQAQVRDLAARLLNAYPRIDVLVNNAGVYRLRRRETADGIEEVLAVNHLAPFLLTNLLLDRLRASAPARIVTVASAAHLSGHIDLDDLQMRRSYGHWRAYARAKLANVMFTFALARRLENSGMTANCYHPGFVETSLGSGNRIPVRPFFLLMRPFIRSAAEGARTGVYLATSGEVEGLSGGYFHDEVPAPTSSRARDEGAQERLWEESARLTGLA